jgi:hypothetical protein
MRPIRVRFIEPAGTPPRWGWWIDTVARGATEAIVIPIGGQGAANRNPVPVAVPLDRLQVINGRNPDLPLEDPYP